MKQCLLSFKHHPNHVNKEYLNLKSDLSNYFSIVLTCRVLDKVVRW